MCLYVYLLVYFPFAVINAPTKSNLGKKGLIWLIGHSLSLREVRVGTKGGMKAESNDEHCLLAHSQAHSQLPPLFI